MKTLEEQLLEFLELNHYLLDYAIFLEDNKDLVYG